MWPFFLWFWKDIGEHCCGLIYNRQLQYNSLSGGLPQWLVQLPHLSELWVLYFQKNCLCDILIFLIKLQDQTHTNSWLNVQDKTLKFGSNFKIFTCFFSHFHISHNHVIAQAKDISISCHNLKYFTFGWRSASKLKGFKQVMTLDFLQCGIGLSSITILVAPFPQVSLPTMPLGLSCK